jgi:hypothetical protein
VGLSLPVQCDEAIYNERVSLFPKPQSESDEMVDKYKRLEESCLKLTGKIVNCLNTISVARDHEAAYDLPLEVRR